MSSQRPIPDKYTSFADLEKGERLGVDYRVRSVSWKARTAIVAPHGGRIEPGTSEIAEAIAGEDFSFYAFEGIKGRNNGRLHITSTGFDEPACLALVTQAERVIAIHGENSDQSIVFLGGRDQVGVCRIREVLERCGFCLKKHTSPWLQGIDVRNICNRGKAQAGVQVELSSGLRRSFFRSVSASGCKKPNRRLQEFVAAVRKAVSEHEH